MNRKFARLIPFLALALAVPMFGQAGAATAASGAKVGIIDIQQAIVRSNEGQRDFEALAKKFEPKRSELEGQNKDVEELKKKLQNTGDKLSEEARGSLVKEIETKTKSLQRNYEDSNNEFQTQQNEIAQRIGQKMMQTVDKYAKENGYGLILDISGQQSPVLWAAPTVDVTGHIIEAYNAVSGVAAPSKGAAPAKPAGAAGKPGSGTPKK